MRGWRNEDEVRISLFFFFNLCVVCNCQLDRVRIDRRLLRIYAFWSKRSVIPLFKFFGFNLINGILARNSDS